jgi:hypothetical protein
MKFQIFAKVYFCQQNGLIDVCMGWYSLFKKLKPYPHTKKAFALPKSFVHEGNN